MSRYVDLCTILAFLFSVCLVVSLPAIPNAESTSINIGSYTTYVGSNVTVPIEITNATDVAGGSAKISFDPSIVNVQELLPGDFGATVANINNTIGFVSIATSSTTAVGKDTADAELASIKFKGISKGLTTLNITEAYLNYETGTGFTPETSDGEIAVLAPPTPSFIYGYVFYENGSECHNPLVNVTNLNAGKERQAETCAGYNYYQLVLANGIDINASEALQFNVTSPARGYSNTTSHTVTPEEINLGGLFNFNVTLEPNVFDTGPGTYPSIFGVHTGNFTPKHTITVSQIYTYPCSGTGGHSERVIFYDGEDELINVSWNGYQGDYHNITVSPPVTLLEGKVYGYKIITGSYPQIIHASSKEVTGGTITCDKFIDANGREHKDWIPAIRLSP